MGNSWSKELIKQINDSTMPILQECFQEAIRNVRNSWMDDLERTYKKVAQDFYDSYTPNPRHGYQRRGTLNKVFVVKRDKQGNPQLIDFDPHVMTYRSGYSGEDGLYETVFKQGSHGGATGDHPSPDTFWWRKPPKKYWWWYEEAQSTTPSPYEDMLNRTQDYFQKQVKETPSKIENEMFRLFSERIS